MERPTAARGFRDWARKRLDELLRLKTDLAGLEQEQGLLGSE